MFRIYIKVHFTNTVLLSYLFHRFDFTRKYICMYGNDVIKDFFRLILYIVFKIYSCHTMFCITGYYTGFYRQGMYK